MKEDRQDLTTGSIWGKMLFFSIPLVLTNFLQVLFNMADIAVIGQFAGSLSLGAVGSTTTLVTLFTGFLIGMGGGTNVLVARFFGAKDKESTIKTIHTALLVSMAAGMIVLIFGLLFSKGILELLNTKEELLDGAVLYIRIYFLGMPAMALYNFGNAVCSAFGDTKKPLYYLGAAGIVNIVLNLFFVIVCKMDVAGVAAASIISQYLSAFLILRALVKVGGDYALRLSKLRFDKRMAGYLIQIGLPAGLQNGIFQVANLFIQSAYRNLDTKGRLLLPPEYRDALLAAGDGSFWLTIGLYGGLKAYMPADWEAIVEKLNSVPLPSMKLSHVKTKLLGLAQRMVPDAQGRIRIPQPLMRAAALGKDVVLVGMADKFEIWDQARFDALLVEDVSDEVAACHLDIAL